TAAERAAAFIVAPAHLGRFAPCPPQEAPSSCARAFTDALATRAWGRAPTTDEQDRLAEVFRAGQDGGDYAAGIQLLAEAGVQSPSFVYRSELGEEAGARGEVRLAPHEIASALSFLLQGQRPDDLLRTAAAAGGLATANGREREARRLLGTPESRRHVRGFLR